jgi:hypothetical protein
MALSPAPFMCKQEAVSPPKSASGRDPECPSEKSFDLDKRPPSGKTYVCHPKMYTAIAEHVRAFHAVNCDYS